MNGQAPSWVQDVEGIEQCLRDIQSQMESLRSMHASRVGSVFGKGLDDMETKIENQTRNITDQFRYAERLLQKVGAATRRTSAEEAQIGANVQRRYVLISEKSMGRSSSFVSLCLDPVSRNVSKSCLLLSDNRNENTLPMYRLRKVAAYQQLTLSLGLILERPRRVESFSRRNS